MNDWEKFNGTTLPDKKKKKLQSLNMEDITDASYDHAKRVCKDFKTKRLGEYHGLCVQSGTLLLVDVFVNFRNICHEIYEFDSFSSWISMESSYKKN